MGLFWHTLKLNRKNLTDQGKRLKNKWWHRGSELVLVLLTKCNYHCSYCPMFLTDNKYPKFTTCGINEWKKFIEDYPEWLNLIYISGGEPSFVPWISEFTNWLVDRGHRVIIFSNMAVPQNFYGIKKHWRFILVPTFHPEYDTPEHFTKAYNDLKDRFRIIPQEMESEHKMSFTQHKEYFTVDWFKHDNYLFHVAPDGPRTGKIYLGCNRLYKDGK
jgi:organic radical activating enzyme